jgi:hypothetical protein
VKSPMVGNDILEQRLGAPRTVDLASPVAGAAMELARSHARGQLRCASK